MAPDGANPVPDGRPGATAGVTALYQGHAVGLIRLAIVMLGDRVAAEDVVQEAFFGLYRHWDGLADPGKALAYLRSAVLNRCRNALRQRSRDRQAAATRRRTVRVRRGHRASSARRTSGC